MALVDRRAMTDVLAQHFAKSLQEQVNRSTVLLNKMWYGDGPPPRPTLDEVCAKHFPRLAAIVRAPARLRCAIAAARYRLGVAVIGYDPAPDDDY